MTKKQISILTSALMVLMVITGCAPSSPKNVIVMIADGCGYEQIDAASQYQYGKTGIQPYEKFPVRCGMTTYPHGQSYDPEKAASSFDYVKHNVTDSAAAATAMSTGYKTDNGKIGVDKKNTPLRHIIDRCEELGKSTGVITTVYLSHATPAGFVAHNESRGNYKQISKEMINDSAVDVIMGCGHPFYNDDGMKLSKAGTYKFVGGKKTWNALLENTAGSDADSDGIDDKWTLIQSRDEFTKLANGDTPKRLIGVAKAASTLQQRRSGDSNDMPYAVPLTDNVPTLAEMTNAALNVLDNDSDGFFIMIEGGAVDWAGHANQLGRMIEEEIDFNKSIEAVIAWVETNSGWNESLIIVTGDHETGYLIDGKWNTNGHTNQLIPFFAKGRGAHLFKKAQTKTDPIRGKYIDNTDIAKMIFKLLE